MIIHRFLFTRIEKINRIENAVLLLVEHRLKNPEKVFEAIIAGVDDWVQNTEGGRKTHYYTVGDTNIGDLAGDLDDENSSLLKYLKKHGVIVDSVVQISESHQIDYDRHLCTIREES